MALSVCLRVWQTPAAEHNCKFRGTQRNKKKKKQNKYKYWTGQRIVPKRGSTGRYAVKRTVNKRDRYMRNPFLKLNYLSRVHLQGIPVVVKHGYSHKSRYTHNPHSIICSRNSRTALVFYFLCISCRISQNISRPTSNINIILA